MDHRRTGMSRRGGEVGSDRASVRFAWLPIPVSLLLYIAFESSAIDAAFEPRLLLLALDALFITGVSLVVTWIAARSYLSVGSPAVLLAAWGSLTFGLGNGLAGAAAFFWQQPDAVVALNTVGAFVAGLCFLSSGILMARPERPRRPWSRPTTLAVGLAIGAGLLLAIAVVKLAGWSHPEFYGPAGPTLLRQVLLCTAAGMFAFAGILVWVLLAETPADFVCWYCFSLVLVAVGLSGVLVERSLASATSWVARVAQYLGCAYLCVAVRSGPSHTFPLVQLLRETRDRYRRLVELSPDAIFVHTDGKYVFANPAGLALFGASSPDDLLGREVLDLVHPRHRELVRERMAVVEAGNTTPLREFQMLRVDGTAVDVETLAAPVEFRGQPATQVVMRDITARKLAEEALEAATREAERRATEAAEGKQIMDEQAARLAEANRVKDEFLATLSHELRTPLNAILGWSHMLSRGMLDPTVTRSAVESIHRNAEAQVALINDVLDVSRIVSGKLRLETAHVDLGACLQNALAAVRPAAAARQVEILESVEPGVVVWGDSDRLQQVLWNLLSNAVKFTSQGGRVTVTIRRTGPDVLIRVEDTGIGIPGDFLPRVFERFSQADGSTTRSHGGLGIGLAIVRHLVELHGGRVEAESEGAGRGATFSVHLPVPAIADRPDDWLKRSEFGPRVDNDKGAHLSGVRLLLVDDEADARELLTAMLRTCGAEVRAAASVREALDGVQTWHPDVLLADIGMPGEDGYDLMRRLRELPPEAGGGTPAIAVTAYGRAEDRAQVLAAGFLAHVAKPVVPNDLAMVVASAVSANGEGKTDASMPAGSAPQGVDEG